MPGGDLLWFIFPAPFQDQQCTFPTFLWVLREEADGWVGSLQPPGEDNSPFPQGACVLTGTH